MVNVDIQLEDKELLKWFNEIHAALRVAQAGRNRVINSNRGEKIKYGEQSSKGLVVDGVFISSPLGIKLGRDVNSRLIASLEAVVKEVQQGSVLRPKIGK